MPCQVDHCVLCNGLGGLAGGSFIDSVGAPKAGWCVCRLPNAAGRADVELRQRLDVALPGRQRLLAALR